LVRSRAREHFSFFVSTNHARTPTPHSRIPLHRPDTSRSSTADPRLPGSQCNTAARRTLRLEARHHPEVKVRHGEHLDKRALAFTYLFEPTRATPRLCDRGRARSKRVVASIAFRCPDRPRWRTQSPGRVQPTSLPRRAWTNGLPRRSNAGTYQSDT